MVALEIDGDRYEGATVAECQKQARSSARQRKVDDAAKKALAESARIRAGYHVAKALRIGSRGNDRLWIIDASSSHWQSFVRIASAYKVEVRIEGEESRATWELTGWKPTRIILSPSGYTLGVQIKSADGDVRTYGDATDGGELGTFEFPADYQIPV